MSAVISMAHAVPNLCVIIRIFMKYQINWNAICGAIQDLPWRNISSSDEMFVHDKVCTTSLCIFVHNKDKSCFDDQ